MRNFKLNLCIIYLSNFSVDRIQLFKCHPTGEVDVDKMLSLTEEDEAKITKSIVDLYILKEKIWSEKGFNISIRFLNASVANYWENVYKRKLPFRAKSCDIKNNTIYLKTDTKLNLCRRYKKISDIQNINSLKITDLDLDYFITEVLDRAKKYVLDRENYKQFSPCYNCKLFNKTCNPCVELSRDNSIFIEINECNKYLEYISNNSQCYI